MSSIRWFGSGTILLGFGVLLYAALVVDDLPDVTHEVADLPENFVELRAGQSVGQTFQPPSPNLSGVALSLRRPPGQRLSGDIVFHVRESPDATDDLRTVRLPTSVVQGDRFNEFLFSPINTRQRESLYAFVEYPAGTEEAPLLLRAEQREVTQQKVEEIVDYAGGTLTKDHRAVSGDLIFQLLKRGRRPFSIQVAGATLLGGVSLLLGGVLSLVARRRWMSASRTVPAVLLVMGAGLPAIFYLPLLIHPFFLGIGDWDMNTTLHMAAERALIREQTFPGWNPYLCGGTPLAAFPEAPVFSPFFSTVLLGGSVFGFKINILLHGAIGFVGMLLWLRKGWKVSWLAAFVGAAVVTFSSFVGLHLAAGHSRKVAAAWIPWVLFFFQRALGQKLKVDSGKLKQENVRSSIPLQLSALRFAAPAAAALALMFLDGSVYLSLYTATFVLLVGVLASMVERRPLPFVASVTVLLLAGLLGGMHLVPTVFSQATLTTTLEDGTPPLPVGALWNVFFDPDQRDNAQKFSGQVQPWFEYGAYAGLGPALLGALGLVGAWRSVLPWVGAGLFFALVPISLQLQHWLDVVPVLGDLRNPQRMAGMVTIVIGLTAALGYDRVIRWLTSPVATAPASSSPFSRGAVRVALAVLAAIMIGHLMFVNTETLASTFVIPPPAVQDAPFRQGWARNRLVGLKDSFAFTLENTLQNHGSINRCSVASVRPSGALRLPQPNSGEEVAAEFLDAPYLGEAFILEGQGTVTVEEHATSRVRVRYETASPSRLALNQNYHAGWRVQHAPAEQQGRAGTAPAALAQGIVTTVVPAGSGTVIFSYTVPGLGIGILATAVGVLVTIWLWRFTRTPWRAPQKTRDRAEAEPA